MSTADTTSRPLQTLQPSNGEQVAGRPTQLRRPQPSTGERSARETPLRARPAGASVAAGSHWLCCASAS